MHESSTRHFYCYKPDANTYAGVVAAKGTNVVALHLIDDSIGDQWNPMIVHGFSDNPSCEGDFPSLTNLNCIPIASKRAWDVLAPLIHDDCEALPLIYPTGEPYFLLHVLTTIDCLNLETSEFRRSQVDGRINRIYCYSFDVDKIRGKSIFKLPIECGGELIIDDHFRRIVEENELKGLKFDELRTAKS